MKFFLKLFKAPSWRKRLFLLAFLSIALSGITFLMPGSARGKKSQTHADNFQSLVSQKILQAKEDEALRLIEAVPQEQRDKNFMLQFLQAYLQIKTHPHAAIKNFEKINQDPKYAALKPYSLYFKALAQKQSEKYQEAQISLQQALKQPSSSYFQNLVRRELGELHCHQGQKAEADLFFEELKAQQNPEQRYRLEYQQALCWINLKAYPEARKRLHSLYFDYPEGQLRPEILQSLQKYAPPRAADHFKLAQKLLELKRPDLAAEEFKLAYHETEFTAAQLETWAQAYFDARHYPEAVKIYGKIQKKYPEKFDLKMQETLARAYSRSDEFDKASELYEDLLKRDPKASRQDLEYRLVFLQYDKALNLPDTKSGREELRKAITQLERYLQAYPKSSRAEVIQWKIFWCYYFLQEFPQAQEKLKLFSNERSQYWQARLAEKMGQKLQAESIYRELSRKNSYYGLLSLKRLQQNLKPEDAPRDPSISQTRSRSSALSLRGETAKQQQLSTFLETGLWEYFKGELEALPQDELKREGLQNIRDQIFSPPLVRVQEKEFSVASYPLAYENMVQYFSRAQGIPPQLSWAISREESRFKPDIMSQANAVGLMQLIPPTASEVARKLHRYDFQTDQLKNPVMNLELGIFYLGSLVREFNGNIIYAIASYNAGPHNVSRWMKGRPLEWDEFAERIPYLETQNYVKKVLRSFYYYEMFYGLIDE